VVSELTREGSWLSTDEGYTCIRELALHGKICVITEDIRNDYVFNKISKLLIGNGFSIDTLYVSNISSYMYSNEDKMNYKNTISHLFTFDTKLIHCVDALKQTVLLGSEFVSGELELKNLFALKTIPFTQGLTVEKDSNVDANQFALALRNPSFSNSSNSSRAPQLTPEQQFMLWQIQRLARTINS